MKNVVSIPKKQFREPEEQLDQMKKEIGEG
jgi:hypothetical protein